MTLRVVFMGTPAFAVPTFDAILSAGHTVVACYTRPPAAAGRGMGLRPSPVHDAAARAGIPVLTPATLRTDDAGETVRAHGADLAVVVAYGLILPKAILEAPRLGCLNLHASLLPRWRGAAPIQRAVMAGDPETGVAVMRMEEGLDTGPVAVVERVEIPLDMTAGELHDRLAPLGAALMADTLARLATGAIRFTPQAADGVTYARKIANADARIDWAQPARAVHDHVRGLSPVPGAFFTADLGRGAERIKVLRSRVAQGDGVPGTLLDHEGAVACREGAIRLVEVQRAGRPPLSAPDFLRGARLPVGAVLAADGRP